jgi:hypothetical protein
MDREIVQLRQENRDLRRRIQEQDEAHRLENEQNRREIRRLGRKLVQNEGALGKLYLTLARVKAVSRTICDLSNVGIQRSLDSIRGYDCAMKYFLPSIQDLQKFNCAMHHRGNIQVNFRRDIFGNVRVMGQASAEGAHIQPHSKKCHRFFEALNELRLGLNLRSARDRRRYKMFLYGRVPKGGRTKEAGSSFLGSALNIMTVQSQKIFFDAFPSGMYIPLVDSADELWKWDGSTGLEYIVICDKAETYVALGATKSRTFIASDNPKVATSFEAFGEIMSVVISLLIQAGPDEAPEKDNIRALWQYLKRTNQFPSPVLASGTRGVFLKIKLGPAKIGRGVGWRFLTKHPSPDPINLICRSYNAFLTWLFQKGQLRAIGPSRFKACKLFPSCLDLPGEPDCSLCIASGLLHGPDYCCLEPDDRDFLLSVVNLECTDNDSKCRHIWKSIGNLGA